MLIYYYIKCSKISINIKILFYFIGTLIPKSCVEALKQDLSSDAEKTEEHVSNL